MYCSFASIGHADILLLLLLLLFVAAVVMVVVVVVVVVSTIVHFLRITTNVFFSLDFSKLSIFSS